MIDIRGDGWYIDVKHSTEWDSNLNNHAGGNKSVIQIDPGVELENMKNDIVALKNDLALMRQEKDEEVMLRNSHPGLKDLYDKYQSVYKLVKQTVDTLEDENGS